MQLNFHTLLRYLLAGGGAALIDYAVFNAFTYGLLPWLSWFEEPSINVYIANTSGLLSGFFLGFFLQRQWVFQSNGHISAQFLGVLALLLFNTVWSGLLINALSKLGLAFAFGKLVTMGLIVGMNFIVYKYIIFKKNRTSQD